MLSIFKEFRIAQDLFVGNLSRLCTQARDKYNKDTRNDTKIEKCRINVNTWGPNEGKARIGIQIWVAGGYPTMYSEQVRHIEENFKSALGKKHFLQKSFYLSCYVSNVHTPSVDD